MSEKLLKLEERVRVLEEVLQPGKSMPDKMAIAMSETNGIMGNPECRVQNIVNKQEILEPGKSMPESEEKMIIAMSKTNEFMGNPECRGQNIVNKQETIIPLQSHF